MSGFGFKQFTNSSMLLINTRFVKYGLPFFVMMIGGSFVLRNFTNLRYEYSKKVILRPEELAEKGIYMKTPGEVTLESEYEKIKDLDIDSWTNVRVPRPWEEGPVDATK